MIVERERESRGDKIWPEKTKWWWNYIKKIN
jgi:hypothetical protein